jgi:hypothetical protein
VKATVAIPGDPDDVWYDAAQRRVYISCGDGYLAVISQTDPDHYETIAKLPTQRGNRTSLYDPASNRLYLLVPRQSGSPAPEVWVFQTHS